MPTIYLKNHDESELRSRVVSLGETKKERGTTDQTSSITTISESLESTTNLPYTEGEVLRLKKYTTA